MGIGVNTMNVCNYRNFRMKYGISLRELADACGFSSQYLSRLELGDVPMTARARQRIWDGLCSVLLCRIQSAVRAQEELAHMKETLFDFVLEEKL